jgi:hypothetical protein
MSRNTALSYLYRDGSNYKTANAVVFSGAASEEYLARLRRGLQPDGGDLGSFVPGQVGLKDLQDSFHGCESEWDPDRDHPFHEVTRVEVVDAAPTDARSIAEFAREVERMAAEWDPGYLPPFHDVMARRREARLARETADGEPGI